MIFTKNTFGERKKRWSQLLSHSFNSFIFFSGMFPHKLTDTCPNAFAWGIIAFWILVVLVDRNDRTRGTVTKFGQFTEARFKGHRKEMVKRVAGLQGPGIPGWFREGSYLIKQGAISCFPACLFPAVILRLLLPVSNCYLIVSQLKYLSAATEENLLGFVEMFPFLLSPENVAQEFISMQKPWRLPFIADSILSPGMICRDTKGLFKNLSRTEALASLASWPLPHLQLLFLDCWFPCFIVAAISKTPRLLCLVLSSFELSGAFEAHQPLGNSVAPLWDTRNIPEGKKQDFIMCLLLFCPSFSLNKRHHVFSHFSGKWMGKDTEWKNVKVFRAPLPPPMCASNTLRLLFNLGQKDHFRADGRRRFWCEERKVFPRLLFSLCWSH